MGKPVVFITGCSRGGIGDAVARCFASRGYHVLASVRDPSKAEHLSGESGIEVVTLDVTSTDSVSKAAAEVRSRLPGGKLDILVNNAGLLYTGPLIEADLAKAKRLYDVNVWGALATTQAFAPMLIAARGTVVNVSSVGSMLAMPWMGKSIKSVPSHGQTALMHDMFFRAGLYHSSKAAIAILSETLRLELAPFGVTVVTGMLGNVTSNIHNNDQWQNLHEASLYKSIEPHISRTAAGNVGPKKEDADEFAAHFVSDILAGASGKVWRGTMAQTVRFFANCAPTTILDSMLRPGSGLDVVASDNGSKKSK